MVDLIVPIVTPFTEENKIDGKKLRDHADFLLKNGAEFLLLCGTTGLGPSVSFEEKKYIIEQFSDIPDKVIMQVNSLNLDDSLSLTRLAKSSGFRAVASLPPYYYPRFPEDWYIRFYSEISRVYPTIVYNFPLTTNYDVQPSLVKKIVKAGGEVIGIKDTTTDLNHMLNFKWEFANDFVVYCGPDPLIFSSLRSGLDGAVAGTANYAVKRVRSIFDNAGSSKGMEHQKVITALSKIAQKYGQWAANYSMVKIISGHDAGLPRPPVFPLSPEVEKALSSEVHALLGEGD